MIAGISSNISPSEDIPVSSSYQITHVHKPATSHKPLRVDGISYLEHRNQLATHEKQSKIQSSNHTGHIHLTPKSHMIHDPDHALIDITLAPDFEANGHIPHSGVHHIEIEDPIYPGRIIELIEREDGLYSGPERRARSISAYYYKKLNPVRIHVPIYDDIYPDGIDRGMWFTFKTFWFLITFLCLGDTWDIHEDELKYRIKKEYTKKSKINWIDGYLHPYLVSQNTHKRWHKGDFNLHETIYDKYNRIVTRLPHNSADSLYKYRFTRMKRTFEEDMIMALYPVHIIAYNGLLGLLDLIYGVYTGVLILLFWTEYSLPMVEELGVSLVFFFVGLLIRLHNRNIYIWFHWLVMFFEKTTK